jgi:ribose 5-phosphate isomerase
MQPLVLDIRGNPIEDAYLTLADKMLSKTVILGWDIKKLQRKADCLIDLTSYIDSFDKVDHSKKLIKSSESCFGDRGYTYISE